uniref:Methyltransferase domain-containing protein n=1 Tax=viral metagenome TaxID=1070528 RepID=A0A6C0BQR8_9ZZZZ
MDNLVSDPFGTHRPCLVDLVKHTTGNIIEFGCGNSSTVLIRDLIKNTDRKLISLESNLEWLNKFKHLEDENHKLFHINAGNVDNDETGKKWIDFIKNNTLINNLDFEVCFIDQSPWAARTHSLNYFKDKCQFIIVHDVDYFPLNNKWGKIINETHNNRSIKRDMDFSDTVKHYKVFYPPFKYYACPTGPPTLLCSNILTDNQFNNMCVNIDYEKYYS